MKRRILEATWVRGKLILTLDGKTKEVDVDFSEITRARIYLARKAKTENLTFNWI